jgi:hypothetical protein
MCGSGQFQQWNDVPYFWPLNKIQQKEWGRKQCQLRHGGQGWLKWFGVLHPLLWIVQGIHQQSFQRRSKLWNLILFSSGGCNDETTPMIIVNILIYVALSLSFISFEFQPNSLRFLLLNPSYGPCGSEWLNLTRMTHTST